MMQATPGKEGGNVSVLSATLLGYQEDMDSCINSFINSYTVVIYQHMILVTKYLGLSSNYILHLPDTSQGCC